MTQVLANTPKGFETSRYPVTRLYSVTSSLVRKIGPGDLDDREILHYSIPNVQEYGTGMVEDGGEIESDKWILEDECVLISKLNPRKATVCLAVPSSSLLTVASTEFIPLATGSKTDNRFLNYLLQTPIVTDHLTARTESATRSHQRVNPRLVTSLVGPWPDSRTRQQVVEYLDRETAEIDAALAEHKHLRALLLERRAETITAATRPSNPELKEAPLVRLRHVTSLNPSPRVNISPDSAQLFPLFSMDSISEFGPLRPPVLRPYSELATGYSYLEPTDVAYAKVTPCFENGKGLVGAELDGPSFATTELTVLRPAPEVDQNYLALVLQSADFHAVGEASMTGAGGLKRVSEHAARNYRFLLPDKKTQIRIVEQVRLEADETDVLISDSNRLSDLLLERRAALISAAVTGQIDVASHGVSAAERLQDELEVHV